MRVVALTGALLAAAGALATLALAATPSQLYQALLTKPYPDSQLPSGFTSAKVGLSTPGAPAKSHHVVGEASVDVNGPDVLDGIFYAVFPTAADAHGDLNGSLSTKAHLHIVPGGLPGSSLPSHMWAGSITGKNVFGKTVTDGVSAIVVQKGNVLVATITGSGDNTDSGNIPAAIALMHSALKHLAKLSSSR